MKLIFGAFILPFLSLLQIKAQSNSDTENLVFIKSFECVLEKKFVEKYVYPNFSCSATKFSRKISAIDFYGMLRVPIRKMFVSLTLDIRNKFINNY